MVKKSAVSSEIFNDLESYIYINKYIYINAYCTYIRIKHATLCDKTKSYTV